MFHVRAGQVEDIQEIHRLAKELLEASVYNGIPMDDAKFKQTVAMLMGSALGAVFVVSDDNNKPVGFIMGMADTLFFSKKRYATDLCMYVRPKASAYGAFLVRRFIRWAERIPAIAEITLGISSGMSNSERLGRMYERMGLRRVGGMYVLRVQP